jgi:hypothetical protein
MGYGIEPRNDDVVEAEPVVCVAHGSSESGQRQAELAAQEPPAAPEAAAPIPAQTAEPSCAPGRGNDIEVLPATEPPASEAEPRIGGAARDLRA